jgi:hypothetical protein
MSDGDLTSGTEFLQKGAIAFFKGHYQNPDIRIQQPVNASLNWVPSFHFRVHDHLLIAVEASEAVYPMILSLRRVDLEKLQFPIAVYSVCPEEAYVRDQTEAKRLMSHGYGLITIDSAGMATRRASSIPILQQIHAEEFQHELAGLPLKYRQRLARAYEAYCQNAPLGVGDITEVMEGMVLKAGQAAAKKTWIQSNQAKPGQSANTLAAMQKAAQLGHCAAAIGGAQSYISVWRNTSHHFPKNPAKAAQKYRACRHGFLEGIRQIKAFRESMKTAGFNITV